MKTLSLSEAKMKLSSLVDSLNRTETGIAITKNGRRAAVLISDEEYESWHETIAVLSDPQLMADIQHSLARFKTDKVKSYTLEELFDWYGISLLQVANGGKHGWFYS